MMNSGGQINIDEINLYVEEIKQIAQDLRVVFDNMDMIITKLKVMRLWSGEAAEHYYRKFNSIEESFPTFVLNIEKMANHIQYSGSLYDSLNKKYGKVEVNK